MTKLNKSRVLTYLDCGRKYEWGYIRKLPRTMHPSAERGIFVHNIVSKFFDKIKLAEITDPTCQFNDILKKLSGDRYEDLKLYYDNFVSLETERWTTVSKEQFKPIMVEQRFDVKQPFHIDGIVDRIDRNKDGKLCVMDYKTGTVIQNRLATTYMFELTMYAYLYQKTSGNKVDIVGIIDLKKGRRYELPFEQESIPKMLDVVRRVRGLIDDEEFGIGKKPNCFLCSFQKPCFKMQEDERRKDIYKR